MIQWHPLFVHLLRPLLQDYYDLEPNFPVGDLPREADIVVLRRTTDTPPPFHGIWHHLTPWNVFEFKGPSDDPALRDLDLLGEIGLGIDRRLNEQRAQAKLAALPRPDVSFWYLANHLGRRFLTEAQEVFGACEPLLLGLWRCPLMQRAVFLVSRDSLPVEPETVPLHLVCAEPEQVTLQLTEVVLRQPGWWERFGSFLLLFHPHLKQEIERMAQLGGETGELDFRVLVEYMGESKATQQFLKAVGLKQVIDEAGLKRVIDEAGLERVIDEAGLKRVIDVAGLEKILATLTPEQLAALKQRLQ
jgi:hypothetical protein